MCVFILTQPGPDLDLWPFTLGKGSMLCIVTGLRPGLLGNCSHSQEELRVVLGHQHLETLHTVPPRIVCRLRTAETHVRQLPHLPDEQGLLLGWEVWLLTCPLSENAPTPISPVEVYLLSFHPLRDTKCPRRSSCWGKCLCLSKHALNILSVSVNGRQMEERPG